MSKSKTVLVAIGGGELAEAQSVLEKFLGLLKNKSELLIIFDVCIHALPQDYKFDLKNRQPISPKFKKMAGIKGEG